MNKLSFAATAAALSLSAHAVSGQAAPSVDYLSTRCEQALALSALPIQLRADASIYTLGWDGFRKTVSGDGPFTCIVERNHPKSLIPQCVDAAGADEIIPAIIHKTKLAMTGMKPSDIKADFRARAERGEFVAPASIGVNYMMSAYNYIYLQGANRIANIPPHLMHYAPDVTNEDIQAAPDAQRKGLPHINDRGIHGYFIAFVEETSDPSQVQQACAGQVGDFPPDL